MSQTGVNSAMGNQDRPPQHHVHASQDVLPGARGAAPAADYSTEATEQWDQNPDAGAVGSDRPLNTRPVSGGGVAVEGQEGLPEGKASAADKLVGKTQKVVGKFTHKPEMHEKGELRESGGKAAAQGQARAPHD